ncbi:PAS domain-containing protein [Pseudoduganella lurida]|uniref:histidine kinase n=1 Tax=Pseudoduganella lurida TaxID=1036180 RepID=A0A562RJQ0_9BURK|nr:PAS domain-containing protein [Pseudoduganella lurida]TWI69241.1 PAS domain-containing protein [Pseudoduganella lurida]
MQLHDSTYQALFDASPNPYLVLDRDLRIAGANRAFLALMARELADIAGQRIWDAFPADPETVRLATASIERVIRTGKADTMALQRVDLPVGQEGEGSRTRYWSVSHSPVPGAGGAVQFVLLHAVDVTAMGRLRGDAREPVDTTAALAPEQTGLFSHARHVHETNQTLLADLDRLQTWVQQAPGFIAVLRGPDHVYELVNDAAAKVTGPRDYIGKSVRESVPEAEAQGLVALLDQVYRSGEPAVVYGRELQFRRGPGGALENCFVNFIYQPIFGADGAVEGIFVEGTEVTEQYLAQREVEATLRQEARNKDAFLAMLAHELRNPLAPIATVAELLSLGQIDAARVSKASAVLTRQARQLTELVDDLLDVSRMTRGLVDLVMQPTDMLAVTHEALAQRRPVLDLRDQTVALLLAEGPAMVLGDAKRLVQVVANLLNNAATSSPDGSQVTITLGIDAGKVVVSVSDNGVGMTPAVQATAFGLVPQAECSPERTQGALGIGLALARHIVELHDGSISAQSAGPGRGSTFTVVLPHLEDAAL